MTFKHLTLLNCTDETVVNAWLDENPDITIISAIINGLDMYIFYTE